MSICKVLFRVFISTILGERERESEDRLMCCFILCLLFSLLLLVRLEGLTLDITLKITDLEVSKASSLVLAVTVSVHTNSCHIFF